MAIVRETASIPLFPINRAAYTFADAAMLAGAKVSNKGINLHPDSTYGITQAQLVINTKSECARASRLTMTYLQERNNGLFDKIIRIGGTGDFTHPNGYKFHVGVLARAPKPNGTFTYFYASPANHIEGKTGQETPLSRVLTAHSIEEIMVEIQKSEAGGQWPSVNALAEFLNSSTLPSFSRNEDLHLPLLISDAITYDSHDPQAKNNLVIEYRSESVIYYSDRN